MKSALLFAQTRQKKSRAANPARKIVSTLFSRKYQLILIDGVTPLVRVRAPPETWTTKLHPCGSA